jgi:hypothetical protein
LGGEMIIKRQEIKRIQSLLTLIYQEMVNECIHQGQDLPARLMVLEKILNEFDVIVNAKNVLTNLDANQVETMRRRIDRMEKRLQQAKELIDQFHTAFTLMTDLINTHGLPKTPNAILEYTVPCKLKAQEYLAMKGWKYSYAESDFIYQP